MENTRKEYSENDKNKTTGSGYSEGERRFQDGTNQPPEVAHEGAGALVEKYNINDKANSDSSIDDFVETTSKFHHADGTNTKSDEEIQNRKEE